MQGYVKNVVRAYYKGYLWLSCLAMPMFVIAIIYPILLCPGLFFLILGVLPLLYYQIFLSGLEVRRGIFFEKNHVLNFRSAGTPITVEFVTKSGRIVRQYNIKLPNQKRSLYKEYFRAWLKERGTPITELDDEALFEYWDSFVESEIGSIRCDCGANMRLLQGVTNNLSGSGFEISTSVWVCPICGHIEFNCGDYRSFMENRMLSWLR